MTSLLKYHSILYVEDEPQIRANITEYLESYFGEVFVAADGKEAWQMYESHHPDVMILDINLPYMSGLELAQKVRQNDQDVKIVMLTAHTDRDKLLAATELQLTKYLVKPIASKHFKETMEVLAQALQTHSKRFIPIADRYVWDKESETLYRDDTKISLSNKEHLLLKLLLQNRGKRISYEEIMAHVWDDAYERDISFASIKNLVSHLRKKLPEGCIDTLYGEGYLIR